MPSAGGIHSVHGTLVRCYGRQKSQTRSYAMQVSKSEVCRTDPNCELRFGDSSWDENKKSIKYTWFNVNNNAARGGEFPVEAIPQMIEFAVRCGYKFRFE
jgi:hypothetical protein